MKSYYCDKCGCEIKKEYAGNLLMKLQTEDGPKFVEYDLCKECFDPIYLQAIGRKKNVDLPTDKR